MKKKNKDVTPELLKKTVSAPQVKVPFKPPENESRKPINKKESMSNFAPNIELKEHIDFSSDKNLDVNPAILQLAV